MTNKEKAILRERVKLIDDGNEIISVVESYNSDEVIFIYSYMNEQNTKVLITSKKNYMESIDFLCPIDSSVMILK